MIRGVGIEIESETEKEKVEDIERERGREGPRENERTTIKTERNMKIAWSRLGEKEKER